QDADDAVSRHSTFSREAYRQVRIDAADGQSALPATCRRLLALALPAASSGNLEQHPGRIAQVEPTLFARLLDLGHALILVIGMNGAQHVLGTQLPASDGRQHVLDIL